MALHLFLILPLHLLLSRIQRRDLQVLPLNLEILLLYLALFLLRDALYLLLILALQLLDACAQVLDLAALLLDDAIFVAFFVAVVVCEYISFLLLLSLCSLASCFCYFSGAADLFPAGDAEALGFQVMSLSLFL